jgi:adenylosuccinate synthase
MLSRPRVSGRVCKSSHRVPVTDHIASILTGLKCADRLFVSDRAHLVLGFHQIVDGLKEIELGGSSIGTTKKGIGPAYSSKASRSGLRVHHLYDPEVFAQKFRKLVEGRIKRYGHFEYDTEEEIKKYQVSISPSLIPLSPSTEC